MKDVVERIRNLSMAVDMTGCSNESEQKVSDEITRLRAEVERLRSGGCARDQGTTQYCAEAAILAAKVGKLEAECFSLAAWQCKFADGKTGLVAAEGGDTYCAMAKEVERLRAENERLREWNREIALNARELVAENERLRAALRPFAEAADGFDASRIKNPEEWFAYSGIVSATEVKGAITVGDLRRARAALNGQPTGDKHE